MSLRNNDIPDCYKNKVLPDGRHVFHAYDYNGYVCVKVTDTVTKKTVRILHFLRSGSWRNNLSVALSGSMHTFADKAEIEEYKDRRQSARFYKSTFTL
jgi:hypothetical protein